MSGVGTIHEGTSLALAPTGGSTYLGPMTWAELQASAYANGSVGLAALDADASVFITDWGAVMTPSAGKTYWTSSVPIRLAQHSSTALGNDVVYTASGATVTAVASASSGTKTRCTSTAHGLTSANNGVSVAVTGGTNWAVGLYPMTYVDANNYDLDVAWNASFGNPTVTAVTGSGLQTTIKTVDIPAGLLQNQSSIDIESIWEMTSSANSHYLTILLGSTTVLQITPVSVSGFVDRRLIWNRGLKAAQLGSPTALTGYGGGTLRTTAIDTSAATTLKFIGDMRTVNEFIRIAGYRIAVSV